MRYQLMLTLNNSDTWSFDVDLNDGYSIENYLAELLAEKLNFSGAYTTRQKRFTYGVVLFHAISSITWVERK